MPTCMSYFMYCPSGDLDHSFSESENADIKDSLSDIDCSSSLLDDSITQPPEVCLCSCMCFGMYLYNNAA